MKTPCVILLFISMFKVGYAQTYARLMMQGQIVKKKQLATLELKILDETGLPINSGAGLFIGPKGYFVTNNHLLKVLFRDKRYRLQIRTKDSLPIKTVTFYRCEDERRIDLCLLKINVSPNEYFEPIKLKFSKGYPHKGTKAWLIGHCSHPWRSTAGNYERYFDDIYSYIEAVKILGSYRPDVNQGVQFVHMSNLKHCPGDSGGPLFAADGELWGMTTQWHVIHKTDNYFLFISVNEIVDYIEKYGKSGKILPSSKVKIRNYIGIRELSEKSKGSRNK